MKKLISTNATLFVCAAFILNFLAASKTYSQDIAIDETSEVSIEGDEIGVSGPEIDAGGLTTIRSWKPTYSVELKAAEVCHDLTNDVYGIAAIFRETDGEKLYYIRVNGNSGSGSYGQLINVTYVDGSSTSIDHVDCAQSGGDSIFIVYDKYNADARWVRFVGTTKYGPYYVNSGDPTWKTYNPRIAYQNDYTPTVIIAYHGYIYSSGTNSCPIYTQTFYASTGQFIKRDGHGVQGWPYARDIEWNGTDAFILSYVYGWEWGGATIYTLKFDWDGDKVGDAQEIADCTTETVPPCPNEYIRLAYTDGNKNSTSKRFVLQTDVGSTYWFTQSGILYADPDNPRFNYGGMYQEYFATCEYWGNVNYRIAHTYNAYFYFNPGPPPILVMNTQHKHWDRTPSSSDPHETYSLNNGYWPKACNAADTLTDTEVFLVSIFAGGDAYVYWNIESQD